MGLLDGYGGDVKVLQNLWVLKKEGICRAWEPGSPGTPDRDAPAKKSGYGLLGVVKMEAERRRRGAGVTQWTENGLRSCLYLCIVCFRVFCSKPRSLAEPKVIPFGRVLYNKGGVGRSGPLIISRKCGQPTFSICLFFLFSLSIASLALPAANLNQSARGKLHAHWLLTCDVDGGL